MTRRLTTIAAAILAFTTTTAALADGAERTCRYFDGMAFADRYTRDEPSFRMRLAEDCRAAQAEAAEARPGTVRHAMAASYLGQLEGYRQALMDMAHERFLRNPRGGPVAPVSRTGAYLIAREMGLVAQRDRWHARRIAAEEGRIARSD